MTILTIYVSKLSKKILLTEYGAEPLRFEKGSMLYDQMRTMRATKKKGFTQSTLDNINEPVKIAVYDGLANFILSKNVGIGLALHNYHREVMMRYVEAQTEVKIAINVAIGNFCSKYNITEDDYAYETSYRRFSFFKSCRKKIYTNFGTKVLSASSLKMETFLKDTDQLLIAKSGAIIDALEKSRKRINKCAGKHMIWYVLYKYGNYSVREVAAKTGGCRNTVWNGIQSINAWCITDQHVAATIKAVMTAP